MVTSECFTDTLTTDTNKFASPAFTYNVNYAAEVFSWTDAAATSLKSLTTCGPLTWEVTMADGVTPIDSNVFTLETTTKKINIYSTDFAKV